VLNDALESLGPSPDPIAFARFLWSQSRLQTARGSTDTAARYAEQALSIVKSTEHVEYAARAHHLVAYIELERGNPQGALEALERAEPLIELAGDRPAAALFRLERARALVALGAFDEAKALAEELVREAEGLSPVDSARALAVIARVFAAAGETQRALGLYEAAADVLADLESAPMLVSVYSEWSDLLADAGRTDEALEVARRGMHSRLGGASRI
jgi:tetratricopeptide (TPR) repeat protein